MAKLEMFETDNVTPAATDILGEVAHGATHAGSTWNLWNEKTNPSGDPAQDVFMTVLERPRPTGPEPDPDYHQQGQATLGGWVEIRVTGNATVGLKPQSTPWTPLGRFRRLGVADIPPDSYREVEWRISVPQGIASEEIDIRIVSGFDEGPLELSNGFLAARISGVAPHIGDETRSLIVAGGDLTEDSPAGADVLVADLQWVKIGVPYAKLAHQITFNDQDGSAATLASGEEYIATLSGGAGTITVTKSDKGTAPLGIGARPNLPEGEALIGYVVVAFGLVIETADLDFSDRRFGRFGYEGATGLNVSIGPGVSIADDRMLETTGVRSVTLTASQTQTVFALPSGAFESVLSGSDPSEPNANSLHEFVTDGSGVTSQADKRSYADARDGSIALFIPGTLAVSDSAAAVYGGRQTARLSLPETVVFRLGSSGTGTGSTKVDLHKSGTTIFTSQGSDDRRPDIVAAASPALDTAALPEDLAIEPGDLLEAIVDAIPSNSDSADAAILLRVHEG